MLGHAAQVLSGVDVAAASVNGHPAALGKAVLVGSGSPGASTPGRVSVGDGGGALTGIAAGIGSGRDGRVTRAVVRVSDLPVVHAAGGVARDASAVGEGVRGRVAALQSCYEREGRERNATLAGMVAVAVTVGSDGRVRVASVTRRSWSGPGAAETEACVLAAVRRWSLNSAEAGTYEFTVSFTAGG